MAFTKNNRGLDLMTQSPADVDSRQLRDLAIQVVKDARAVLHQLRLRTDTGKTGIQTIPEEPDEKA